MWSTLAPSLARSSPETGRRSRARPVSSQPCPYQQLEIQPFEAETFVAERQCYLSTVQQIFRLKCSVLLYLNWCFAYAIIESLLNHKIYDLTHTVSTIQDYIH